LDCSGSTCPVGTVSQKSLKLKTVSFSENGSHLVHCISKSTWTYKRPGWLYYPAWSSM